MRAPAVSHLLALALVALVTLFRLWMGPLPPGPLDGGLFILPIVLVALWGGLGAALTAAAGSIVAYLFAVMAPVGSFVINDRHDLLPLAVLALVGVAVAALVGRARDAQTRAEAAMRALRASEQKFERAFNRSPLALTITSLADGRLIEVNDGFVRLSGYTREEAIGRSPDELGLWTEPEARAERFAQLRRGEPVPDIEARFTIKSGEELVGIIGSAVVDVNGIPAVVSSVLDVTARHRLEAELLRRADDLAAANRMKDEFLATLSHELRTPLNVVRGRAAMLKADPRPEMVARAAEAIERNTATLEQLVGDLLDVSRLSRGQLRLECTAVDVSTIVDAAVSAVQPAVQAKQIRLGVEVPVQSFVWGDSTRLQQVLWNLLTNAIKFTPAGGTVSVSAREESGQLTLQIRDTGIGIAPDMLPRVFDRFWQADAAPTRRFGGLGLGLSIARTLVELHGGEIEADSDGPERGATFTIRLPVLQRA
jgi:PAS domain S-box-containing protein